MNCGNHLVPAVLSLLRRKWSVLHSLPPMPMLHQTLRRRPLSSVLALAGAEGSKFSSCGENRTCRRLKFLRSDQMGHWHVATSFVKLAWAWWLMPYSQHSGGQPGLESESRTALS